ncbi:MAG: hypothetical protein FJ128_12735 [Deltaproteobacteria bacterium]|nr:hypothetical protein [Deltaproteobacteria bacterium]
MTEMELRARHRAMGVILALFIFLQAGTGVVLVLLSWLPGSALWELRGWLEALHLGGGGVGRVYRLLVGLGTMGMALSGALIFLKIRARTRKP